MKPKNCIEKEIADTRVIYFENGGFMPYKERLIPEEPLVIRIEGQPYSVVMRTPGDEIAHGAGFCLAEGLVGHPDDFAAIGFCKDEKSNVLTITLAPSRRKKVSDLLKRRGFISQTSCGICGKELIKDIFQIVDPVLSKMKITVKMALECRKKLESYQNLYKKTGSSHASMILDKNLNILSAAEDVGRHNALDKAIGKVFMKKKLDKAKVGVLSSRMSYELIQKAARAKLPVLVGMSRPTKLAVDLGRKLNMTLVSVGKRGGVWIFSGKKRLDLCKDEQERTFRY